MRAHGGRFVRVCAAETPRAGRGRRVRWSQMSAAIRHGGHTGAARMLRRVLWGYSSPVGGAGAASRLCLCVRGVRQGREICRRREGRARRRVCVCGLERARARAGFGVARKGVRVAVLGGGGWGCVLGARVSEGEARDSAAAVYNSSVALATFRRDRHVTGIW
ncbi:Uncharacterized protein FWK35_00016245 [Aphis craccivora]|uniref:Uncharacterized protein n=1 Tax=Aphis craccivora TaxID=307492 RepID=A0A6G0YFV7_APHCR|nr:Uncharacterized protein FWK35_00016245 [Aphis craccivora]